MKDGGQVFGKGTLTLRDYFASAALQAHIAGGITNGAIAAESSYRYADAMLTERDKAEPQGEPK